MKKYIMLFLALLMLSGFSLFGNIPFESIDITTLPEYTGELSNPDILVVYKGDGYLIVLIDGKYYVYYQK
jgi:hypothetical protein